MFSTPAVFAALFLCGYLLSVLGNTFGVQTLVAVGQAVTIGAAVMLGAWIYTRYFICYCSNAKKHFQNHK